MLVSPRSHGYPPLLFNVKDDVEEKKNIAADRPDLVKRLQQEFEQAEAAIQDWKPFHN